LWWLSGTATGICPGISAFPCQYHSTNAPYFIYKLFLTEGQAGYAGEPSKSNALSEISEEGM
jgi:hypothetical protein